MERISKYISYNEATVSQTATRLKLNNTPDKFVLERMKYVGVNIFDKVREHFGVPIRVSSFYRGPQLNKAIGGAKNSQHMTGEAIDMQAISTITNKQIFDYIRDNMEFDQLIEEYPDKNGNPAWVHVSLKKTGNRKQILTIK